MSLSIKSIYLLLLIPVFVSSCRTDPFIEIKKYIYDNYAFREESSFSADSIIFSEDFGNKEYDVITKQRIDEGRQFLADEWYVICIKKTNDKWRVIYDLTRSDVPSGPELEHIRKTFPEEFPRELLPPYWQKMLRVN